MTEKTVQQELISLRHQVRALASVSGVLLAALRRGGLMGTEFEGLLSAEMVDAVAEASRSAQVRDDWIVVFDAVQKVSIATARSAGRASPA